jgi:hypothetical protein
MRPGSTNLSPKNLKHLNARMSVLYMGEWLPQDCCELSTWKRLRAPLWDIPLLRAVGFLKAYLRVGRTQTSAFFRLVTYK